MHVTAKLQRVFAKIISYSNVMSIALVSLRNNASGKLEMQGLKIHNSQSVAQRLVWTNIDKNSHRGFLEPASSESSLSPQKPNPVRKIVVR